MKEAIIGASVVVKGTTNGTITNFDGKFTLSAKEGDILIVSYIGYKTQELLIDQRNEYNFILSEDTQALDEVVVVGYGVQKK